MVAAQAESVARSITDPDRQAQALTAVAQALAATGQHEQAEQLARSITDPDRQAPALTAVAQALAPGRPALTQAESVARSITDPDWQAQALTAVAQALAAAGQQDRAEAAWPAPSPTRTSGQALAAVAQALAQAGWPSRPAVRPGRERGPLHHRPGPAGGGADRGGAGAGRRPASTSRPSSVARSITDPDRQAPALTAVAQALAADRPARARPRAWPARSPTRTGRRRR